VQPIQYISDEIAFPFRDENVVYVSNIHMQNYLMIN